MPKHLRSALLVATLTAVTLTLTLAVAAHCTHCTEIALLVALLLLCIASFGATVVLLSPFDPHTDADTDSDIDYRRLMPSSSVTARRHRRQAARAKTHPYKMTHGNDSGSVAETECGDSDTCTGSATLHSSLSSSSTSPASASAVKSLAQCSELTITIPDTHTHTNNVTGNGTNSYFDSNDPRDWHALVTPTNRFTLVKTLHNSLYGCVKLAYDSVSGARVCVKISCKRSLSLGVTIQSRIPVIENVRQEAALLRQFTRAHTHAGSGSDSGAEYIVRFVDELEDQYFHYLITEYCEGGDLYGLLSNADAHSLVPAGTANNHGLSASYAQQIFIELCRALSFLHRRGVAHRDLSIENVCFTGDGHVRVIDFGLAADIRTLRRERIVSRIGKVAYQSAEVYALPVSPSETVIDWLSNDIHALGVLLYTMLSGRPPYYKPEASDSFYTEIHSGDWLANDSGLHAGIDGAAARLIDGCIKPQGMRVGWKEIWASDFVNQRV